jgi:hypothetical protein
MANFSLDIERFNDAVSKHGGTLKGLGHIQYPVYCIHAVIIDTTLDAFDNLDRVICEFLFDKPDYQPQHIAALMGTSTGFVEQRLESLLTDGLLERKVNVGFTLTPQGIAVFQEAVQKREHRRTFDFYIDGISLQPLSGIFYASSYRPRLISETDSYLYTNARGETIVKRPFGPDIVHTPPDKQVINDWIFAIPQSQRDSYGIPVGLQSIEEIFYTKQTFPLLIAVTDYAGTLVKEIVDGYPLFSLSEKITYYEASKKHIAPFEEKVKSRLKNFEFRIDRYSTFQGNENVQQAAITTNWPEIDRTTVDNRSFSFSSEDLMLLLEQHFQVAEIRPEELINEDNEVGIYVTRNMLDSAFDKKRLLRSLIRGRDYRFGNRDGNAFITFLKIASTDEKITEVLDFYKALQAIPEDEKITLNQLKSLKADYGNSYRELLLAVGELEVLEEIDVNEHMLEIK